jgi:hypothetical protein
MSIAVYLHDDLVEVMLTPASTTVAASSTAQLEAYGFYGDGSILDIRESATWASSDQTKATVSSAGLVTWVAAGSCVITATLDDVSDTCAVTLAAS